MPLSKLFSAFAKRKPVTTIPAGAPVSPASGTGSIILAPAMDLGSKLLDAVALHKQGKLMQAEAAYKDILKVEPRHFDALHYLGLVALQRGQTEQGVDLVGQALAIDGNHTAALGNLAMGLRQLGRHDEALAHYTRAISLKPDSVELHANLAEAFLHQQRYEEAVNVCGRALQLQPNAPLLLQQRGTALLVLRRYEDAIADFDRMLALHPNFIDALSNRGVALAALERNAEAVATYTRALQLKADDIDSHYNRGNALLKLDRLEEAIADYEHVLRLNPEHAGALNNLGASLSTLGRFEAAITPYRKFTALVPEYDYVAGNLFFSELSCCDWSHYAQRRQRIVDMVQQGKKATVPFTFLNASESLADQKQCAHMFAADKFPASANPLWKGERYQHEKIRVAYLSADFHGHATAHLMAGLFEAHDKQRFEIIAISFGPDVQDEMRSRLQSAFDRFIHVRDKSDLEAARIMRELEIDIAVDLKGFTESGRLGILAHRPAPVQVSYLGYPGSVGADYIDYIVADKHLIADNEQEHYAEKVVYLPDSYQVNDSKRPMPEHMPTRVQVGLPDEGFVFCSFNNNYKITPVVFDIWMRLLQRVPGSVLWLYEGNAAVSANLRREAQARGVAPERLIFAPRVSQSEHLARQRLADLFLDTLPVNAHTTASDALWVGLPILTCTGGAFVGRVAASLLHAIGLPELMTNSLEEYEALALKLATMPAELAQIKTKLAQNRRTSPLFDTNRFRRHIESAYIVMQERCQRGESPSSFTVPAIVGK